MALTLEKICAARDRIAPYIITTPLLRLPALDPFFGGVLEGKIPVRPDENVCFVISGGSIAPEQLDLLKNIE